MHRSIALFLALATLGFAQDSTAPATASSTASATESATSELSTTTASSSATSATNSSNNATSTQQGPVTHTVGVALGGFTMVPDVTLGEVGDTVLFQFYPTNHSVIRAAYGFPCVPYEDTGVDLIGFDSGFYPVDAILSAPPQWSLLINDTNPIFYYCGAPGSCINHQMVGVINPNATTSLQHQKDLASQSQFMLLPGQPWPSESDDPFTTTTSASTPTATQSTTSSASATGASSGHSGLSTGAIAGIAIGAAAIALVAAVLLYMCGRQFRGRDMKHINDRPGTGHAGQVTYNPAGSHMSYMTDPNKHMSLHSSVAGLGPSPALPGYVASHDPTMSPPMHPAYMPMSDSLPSPTGPGSDFGVPHTPSPHQMYAVPAYAPHSMHASPHQPAMYGTVPPHNIHEMAASEPGQIQPARTQGAGIMGFIRRSSVNKAGGVERYG